MTATRRRGQRPRLAVSTVSLRSVGAVELLRAAYRSAFAGEALFELSYQWDDISLAGASGLGSAVVAVHAPCPRSRHFPNLGSRDPLVRAEGLADIRRSAQTAREFGGSFVVLHPGYALDAAVPVDSAKRIAALARRAEGEERYVWSWEESICRPGYCESAGYRLHLREAAGNLAEAARLCAGEGLELAVENLNPRITYLFQLPSELVSLVRGLPELRICVDLGHLWISSLVHRFDFLGGLRDILATGRVVSAHVHDNDSRLGTGVAVRMIDAPPDGSLFSDGHLAVGRGRVPIAAAVQLLKRARVDYLVVETVDPPLESVRRLAGMLGRSGG